MIDFNLKQGKSTLNADEDLILQQVDILLDTYPREVLGFEKFGTNYSEFLYDLNISNYAIESTIRSDINSLELFGYSADVSVELLEGTINDILIVRIVFYKGNRSFEKIFKVTQ